MGENPSNHKFIVYMDDENNVNIDTSNDTAEELEINLDETSDEVDVDALKRQNVKLFERAKKAEGFIKQPDGSWVKREQPRIIKQEVETKPVSTYNILEDEVADLIFDGYTKEETKFILSNGGRKALEEKDSFVSLAIKARRDQKKVEEAVSKTSNSGFTAPGGKTFTEAQLKNMTVQEMEKVLPRN